jgi:hypothetical protein
MVRVALGFLLFLDAPLDLLHLGVQVAHQREHLRLALPQRLEAVHALGRRVDARQAALQQAALIRLVALGHRLQVRPVREALERGVIAAGAGRRGQPHLLGGVRRADEVQQGRRGQRRVLRVARLLGLLGAVELRGIDELLANAARTAPGPERCLRGLIVDLRHGADSTSL